MDPNVRTPKKSSSLLYIFLFIVLVLIGYFAYSFVMNQDDKKEDGQNTQQEDDNQNDDSQNEGENENPDSNDDQGTSGDELPNGSGSDEVDLSEFKTSSQSVGSDSNTDGDFYSLTALSQKSMTGYHRFQFFVEPKEQGSDVDTPYVTATYVASLGAIRVDFKGITNDQSGVGYQKSMMINKDGVIKVYHNVSADQTEELYDVGVSKETPFLLSVKDTDTMSWIVTLDVKYPGVSEDSGDVDLGSEEFSKEAQSIVGATRSDGARVSSYSYSASGGVLRIVFEVKGSTAKPIPSVNAGYDGDGKLVMRFTDVVSDAIAKMPAALTMTGGVTMTWEMESSNTSMYTFEGASKEFKLYGGTNPNQVIIEIKL
ncbi:MAG TPA: hypothetical protein PLV59_02950 [Candidatus Dojkabacteria bacterium]|nr:hypothetical protein [Candidatus Dojkabacteria bacterium]